MWNKWWERRVLVPSTLPTQLLQSQTTVTVNKGPLEKLLVFHLWPCSRLEENCSLQLHLYDEGLPWVHECGWYEGLKTVAFLSLKCRGTEAAPTLGIFLKLETGVGRCNPPHAVHCNSEQELSYRHSGCGASVFPVELLFSLWFLERACHPPFPFLFAKLVMVSVVSAIDRLPT